MNIRSENVCIHGFDFNVNIQFHLNIYVIDQKRKVLPILYFPSIKRELIHAMQNTLISID